MSNRDLLAQRAIAQIPKLLTLLDRNPHSPTYGCFDRNFWHYKIIDFPSGMAQEFVWPLALAYDTDCPNNPFYQQESLQEWVRAGISYAACSAHADGSCDDYFPFERASGAAAFSLLACIESYKLLKLHEPDLIRFFVQRSEWLASHHESGQLTNHQALIALCLEELAEMVGASRWDRAIAERIQRILNWQDAEGWFQEYEGCDPGYHTLTIWCLARLYQMRSDPHIKEALVKAVQLAHHFIHPDGSYGGEYGSRNTYNFYPDGFELVGQWWPDALSITDQFLAGLHRDLDPCYADDHIIGHHTWNYFLAWRNFVSDRPSIPPRPTGRIWLERAGILIDRRDTTELYIALNKGGVFKLFRDGQLIRSDTQLSAQVMQKNKVKNAVAHLVGTYNPVINENEITIAGNFGWAKQKQMTPMNLLILRIVMLTVGRFFPNLIRKILQKILITGKDAAPLRFRRQLQWMNGQWQIEDEVWAQSWKTVRSLGIGCDQTSIYVVASRTFQPGQLQPWIDWTEQVQQSEEGRSIRQRRIL